MHFIFQLGHVQQAVHSNQSRGFISSAMFKMYIFDSFQKVFVDLFMNSLAICIPSSITPL